MSLPRDSRCMQSQRKHSVAFRTKTLQSGSVVVRNCVRMNECILCFNITPSRRTYAATSYIYLLVISSLWKPDMNLLVLCMLSHHCLVTALNARWTKSRRSVSVECESTLLIIQTMRFEEIAKREYSRLFFRFYMIKSHSPLLTPVTLSRSTLIVWTRPYSSNMAFNWSSSIDFGTWPTNILMKSGSGFSPDVQIVSVELLKLLLLFRRLLLLFRIWPFVKLLLLWLLLQLLLLLLLFEELSPLQIENKLEKIIYYWISFCVWNLLCNESRETLFMHIDFMMHKLRHNKYWLIDFSMHFITNTFCAICILVLCLYPEHVGLWNRWMVSLVRHEFCCSRFWHLMLSSTFVWSTISSVSTHIVYWRSQCAKQQSEMPETSFITMTLATKTHDEK